MRAAAVAAIAALSVWYFGYVYAVSDMAVYVPMVKRALDPDYLARDWFLNLAEGLHQPFVWLVAQLARAIGVETAFALLHVVERLATVAALFALAKRINAPRFAAPLCAIVALFAPPWQLGGNVLVAPLTIPHTLAIPVALWALVSALAGRTVTAAVLCAVGTYVHLLIGTETFLLLALLHLTRGTWRDRSTWLGLAAYMALVAPLLVPLAQAQVQDARAGMLSTTQYMEIVGAVRAPWHYLPLTWPASAYLAFTGFFASGLLTRSLVRDRLDGNADRDVLRLQLTILALCLVGTVFVEWIPSALVLKLQLFRLNVLLRVLTSLYIGAYLSTVLAEGSLGRSLLGALAIGAVAHAGIFLILTAVLAGLDAFFGQPRRLAHGSAALAVTACGIGVLLTGPAPTVGLMDVLFLVGAALIVAWSRREARITQLAWRREVTVPALVLAALLAVVTVHRVSRFSSTVSERLQWRLSIRTPWDSLCAWVHAETPEDALFITPPYQDDFRVRAERAIVFDFKPFTYTASGAQEWRRRLDELTGGLRFELKGDRYEEMRRGYRTLATVQVHALQERYGAEFIVRETSQPLELPAVYANSGYVVYRKPTPLASTLGDH